MEIISFKSYRAGKILETIWYKLAEFQNNSSFFLITDFVKSIFLKSESRPKAVVLS